MRRGTRLVMTIATTAVVAVVYRAVTAQVDTVSGATFTSEGHRQSLQPAIDAAHRAGAR